jgi:GAF domain-containing protein
VGNHENLDWTGFRDGPWTVADSADARASIAELQALLLGTESIDGFLREVAVLAARTMGEGLSCGITVQPNGRPLTVASSDLLASQVDEVQYGLDEGPCLASLRTGQVVRIDDLAADQRWPRYAGRALGYGVASSLSYPLQVQGKPVGALNVYSRDRGFFGELQTRQAERFAQDASTAVGLAARMAQQAVTDQLRASLASRSVIDWALGVIMGEERCSAGFAFEVLRRASQNRNIKLRQVAEEVIVRVTGEPSQPPPFDPPGGPAAPRDARRGDEMHN